MDHLERVRHSWQGHWLPVVELEDAKSVRILFTTDHCIHLTFLQRSLFHAQGR